MVHFTSSVSIGVAQVRAKCPALTASRLTSRYFAGPRKLGAWSGSRVFPQRQQWRAHDCCLSNEEDKPWLSR